MKVKYASQIFSQRVAVNLVGNLDTLNTFGIGAKDTAELLLFNDKLFDSVNGSTKYASNGKEFRCGINDSSRHIQFWQQEAIPLLETMALEVNKSKDKSKPPSLKNWMFTLKNFVRIWNILKHEGLEFILAESNEEQHQKTLMGWINGH